MPKAYFDLNSRLGDGHSWEVISNHSKHLRDWASQWLQECKVTCQIVK